MNLHNFKVYLQVRHKILTTKLNRKMLVLLKGGLPRKKPFFCTLPKMGGGIWILFNTAYSRDATGLYCSLKATQEEWEAMDQSKQLSFFPPFLLWPIVTWCRNLILITFNNINSHKIFTLRCWPSSRIQAIWFLPHLKINIYYWSPGLLLAP